ncbi:hypothetical protein DNTS_009652 [Danionella cerebrum]|uniref:NTF2 domain-containing protein n=1 Tax=Danionella cerebrum TaxID=2873325 RepID=A0A553N4B3_9TELE|nr:hypothetical protein DNTS_009652 [Danionella translucida]TRY60276.1 hypothetical protein DNTS_009652 [Danionella translucida]
MVMEKPSPQLVGREFVRQYYTLLNKAPDFLHRFYSRNSSYVHGGLDSSGKPEEAVYGQAEIHRKVMSLQFSECSTSIRQVDAQETLSDGIVVQVIGELTTQKREPRRFTQTFVLAPEVGAEGNVAVCFPVSMILTVSLPQGSAVNKFYVLNDIFRYDEELLMDSEAELTVPLNSPLPTCICVESEEEEEEQETVEDQILSPEPTSSG